MADIVTPNMGLTLPTISQTVGPTYAVEINSDLSTLDGHNHSPGSGVQIPSSGLSINADLSFNNVNATTLRSTRFATQTATLGLGTDLRCLYAVNADLYYNDGSGNPIRMTQSGGIAGSPGSISGLASPASATYNSGTGTFIWQQNTNTSANLDAGSLILRNNVASSNGLTLSPPSLGSNYTITLPALPASTSILTIGTAGTISAPAVYPIDFTGIAFGGISKLNLMAVGQIVSSTVVFSTVVKPSGPFIVGSVAASITSLGRPVMLMTQPPSGGSMVLQANASVAGTYCNVAYEYLRDGVSIASFAFTGGQPAPLPMYIPPPVFLDATATAGPHVYQVRINDFTAGSATFNISGMTIMAYEL